MSFDRSTGRLWIGDVGWERWELVFCAEKGGNFGWSIMEGPTPCLPTAKHGPTPILPPAHAIPHPQAASITGGFVYRGQRRPELTGQYIYADYCSRKVWRLKYEGGVVTGDSLIASAPSSVYSFGTDQNNELYLCAANNVVYRFNRSDLVNVNSGQSVIPEGFTLEQNYPNPFNPETRISYYVPEMSKMKLTIYNSQGREVRTLVNTVQLSGNYNIVWNGKDAYGNNAASGAYFYNLTSDNGFSETKRMVLVK